MARVAQTQEIAWGNLGLFVGTMRQMGVGIHQGTGQADEEICCPDRARLWGTPQVVEAGKSDVLEKGEFACFFHMIGCLASQGKYLDVPARHVRNCCAWTFALVCTGMCMPLGISKLLCPGVCTWMCLRSGILKLLCLTVCTRMCMPWGFRPPEVILCDLFHFIPYVLFFIRILLDWLFTLFHVIPSLKLS